MKTAVVLFNLGGPKDLKNLWRFLFNLFSDPAIIQLPAMLRLPIAVLIATLRLKKARAIYAAIGGGSPLLRHTQEQAAALEKSLGPNFKCFIAMRYAPPRAKEAIRAIQAWGAERLVLLPMYPQFSGTTTGSSFKEFEKRWDATGHKIATHIIKSYPELPRFIEALTALIRPAYQRLAEQARVKNFPAPRLLLSAHGLPQKFIEAGDPYATECEKSAQAVAHALGIPQLDMRLCYQSRLGPLEWLEPYTDDEVRRAGAERRPLIIAPLTFTADNSETVYEIEQLYRSLAQESGVPLFASIPCVNAHPLFIGGLAELVRKSG